MDDQRTDRESGGHIRLHQRKAVKYLVASLCFVAAGNLIYRNVTHVPRSEDYFGLLLVIVSVVLVPYWTICGIIALVGAVRTAACLALVPALAYITLAICLG